MINFSSSTNRQRTRSSSTSSSYFSSSSGNFTNNGSCQQAIVNIDSKNLGLPHILNVKISGAQLACQVKVNGKVFKQLKSTSNQLNLSPCLSIGKNIVEILAPYSSSLFFIRVELLGPDTRVVQQTSGLGVLSHTLIVKVR